MPKITITLQAIHCYTPEDASTDEIYVIAGLANVMSDSGGKPVKVKFSDNRHPERETIFSPPGSTDPDKFRQPTHPMSAGSVLPIHEVILEETVDFGPVYVGLWLMDQDASEDISAEELKAMNAAISAAGVALAPATKGASVPVSMLANFFLTIGVTLSWLDSDDLLGFQLTPLDLQPVHPEYPWFAQQYNQAHFKKLIATEDGAHYEVFYFIKVDL